MVFMKLKNKKILMLILFLFIYQTSLYLIAKITPIEINVVGNAIDNKIPFISQFIFAYISWYVMLFLVPYIFYKTNPKSFNKYYITTFLCITIGLFIYFFYPTTMYRANIEFKSISEYLVNIIYKMDTPVLNCFPSMHCVISFIFIYVSLTEKNLNIKYKVLLTIWSLLVIVSTLLVKQHVLVDVISAFILSLIVFVLVSNIKYLKDFDVIKR